MVPLVIFGVVAISLLVAIVVAVYLDPHARVVRALRNAPTYSVRQFPENQSGKVIGKVEFMGEPFHAPLTARPCAAYHVLVEEKRGSGKSRYWKKLIDEKRVQNFLLQQDGHAALIEARSTGMALVTDAHQNSGIFNEADPAMNALLEKHGYSSKGLLGFNRSIRYRESVLEAGEWVTVFGRGRWIPDPSAGTEGGGYRSVAKRLVISASAEGFLISDDPTARSGSNE